jgi:hypothetical protein
MSSSMKRVLLALVLCVACVGAMKLPSQLQAINPKAKVHAAIKVGLGCHSVLHARASVPPCSSVHRGEGGCP